MAFELQYSDSLVFAEEVLLTLLSRKAQIHWISLWEGEWKEKKVFPFQELRDLLPNQKSQVHTACLKTAKENKSSPYPTPHPKTHLFSRRRSIHSFQTYDKFPGTIPLQNADKGIVFLGRDEQGTFTNPLSMKSPGGNGDGPRTAFRDMLVVVFKCVKSKGCTLCWSYPEQTH